MALRYPRQISIKTNHTGQKIRNLLQILHKNMPKYCFITCIKTRREGGKECRVKVLMKICEDSISKLSLAETRISQLYISSNKSLVFCCFQETPILIISYFWSNDIDGYLCIGKCANWRTSKFNNPALLVSHLNNDRPPADEMAPGRMRSVQSYARVRNHKHCSPRWRTILSVKGPGRYPETWHVNYGCQSLVEQQGVKICHLKVYTMKTSCRFFRSGWNRVFYVKTRNSNKYFIHECSPIKNRKLGAIV